MSDNILKDIQYMNAFGVIKSSLCEYSLLVSILNVRLQQTHLGIR